MARVRTRRHLRFAGWMRLREHACAWTRAAGLATLLVAGGDAVAEENFGRWFFSILDRQKLDEDRDKGEELAPVIVGPTETGAPPPVVDVISFDGKVERSDGTSTVWVNGRPVFTGNRTAEGISVHSSRGTGGEAQFVLPRSETDTTSRSGPPPFTLKVGQKVAVQNGRKFDAYEARPGEDAESVIGVTEAVESAPEGEGDKPRIETNPSAGPAKTPGS